MKASDTLKFVFRFLDINQKVTLKKIAKSNNGNSLNKEISIAITNHIKKHKKC